MLGEKEVCHRSLGFSHQNYSKTLASVALCEGVIYFVFIACCNLYAVHLCVIHLLCYMVSDSLLN